MFRRWLRKLSRTFDWRERRLQSLVMALEAAAGSNNCTKLVQWLKRRVAINVAAAAGDDSEQNGESEDVAINNQQNSGSEAAAASSSKSEKEQQQQQRTTEDDSVDNNKELFEREKQVLLSTHKTELAGIRQNNRRNGP